MTAILKINFRCLKFKKPSNYKNYYYFTFQYGLNINSTGLWLRLLTVTILNGFLDFQYMFINILFIVLK